MKLKLLIALSSIFIGISSFSDLEKSTEKYEAIVKSNSFCIGLKELGSDGGTGAETLSRFYDKCVINGKTYSGNIEVTYYYKFKENINGKLHTKENRLSNGKKFLNEKLSINDTMIIKEKTKINITKEEKGYETSTRLKSNNWEYKRISVDYTIELNGNQKIFPIKDVILKK